MADEKKNERTPEPIAVETAKAFAYGEYAHPDGAAIRYRWFTPALEEGKAYPLVIFFHGGGECGDDNELHLVANIGAYAYALPKNQAEHPCYVLAPQCPSGLMFSMPEFERSFMPLLHDFIAQNAVDKQRVYITGLSLGGIGTWHYVGKYPHLFAAALPICGAGDPYAIVKARHVPIWACHAADDPVAMIDDILPANDKHPGYATTRRMVAALRGCGGNIRFTEYPAGYIADHFNFPRAFAGHAAWEPAYRDKEIRDWLFAQDRRKRDEFELLKPGVWYFNDYAGDSYYLVEGRDKALVIDTGMSLSPILPLIRSITDKPLELAVTHIHGDHMQHADEFDKVYIPADDLPNLPRVIEIMMPDLKLAEDAVCAIRDGDVIELGGVSVEAFSLAGHTHGSMVYADHKHQCLFTGDAIGSGLFVLMALPDSLCLSQYKANLERFAQRTQELEDYAWLGGHRHQEWGLSHGGQYKPLSEQPLQYNPLRRQVLLDMIELCGKLLSGELEGDVIPPFYWQPPEPTYSATYGSAGLAYLKSQLK